MYVSVNEKAVSLNLHRYTEVNAVLVYSTGGASVVGGGTKS